MALNLMVTGRETTDRKQIILTDATPDWGINGNIDFTSVQYAEMYVGINGALYGPVILTSIFSAATVQSDLVFTLTPELLGLEDELFEDSLQEYHYGISPQATPPVINRNVWDQQTGYNIPIIDTTNKIPFEIEGNRAISQYVLGLTVNLAADSPNVNPRTDLTVNYQDGTADTISQVLTKGVTETHTLTLNVDRSKEIKNVTGYLLNEDRTFPSGSIVVITNITLLEQDLDIISNVIRGLASENIKTTLNRDFIAFQDDLLCGLTDFERHERLIIRHLGFVSVTNAAKQGLPERAERIINFLNEDS